MGNFGKYFFSVWLELRRDFFGGGRGAGIQHNMKISGRCPRIPVKPNLFCCCGF